jgi:DNA-binding PadR family transcriptional regulator
MDDVGYWEKLISRSMYRFFLLHALRQKPMHGYELGKFIARACSGCCQPSDAMIYPTLHQLLESGHIECHTESKGGRERKVYALTHKGLESYTAAAEAWNKALPYIVEATAASEKDREEHEEE